MPLSWQLLVIALLLVLSAFFSAAESALFSLNRLRLRRKQEHNPLESWFVARLLDNPRRLLQVILFGNELVNVATAVMVAALFYDLLHGHVPEFIVAIVPIVVSLPLLVILGEVVPKAIAVKQPEFVARLVAPPLTLFSWLIRPLQNAVIDPFVSRFVGVFLRAPQEIRFDGASPLDEETFRSMLEMGHSEGEVQDSERRFIHRVLDLDDLQVQQLMTKKDRVFALAIDTPLAEAVQLIKQRRFSRIPVYYQSIERISGMLYTKDLLRFLKGEQREIKSLLRPAYFVPQARKVSEVLRDFQEQHIHIAVVVDEYGRFAGLITLQDILDRLFADVYHDRDTSKSPTSEVPS